MDRTEQIAVVTSVLLCSLFLQCAPEPKGSPPSFPQTLWVDITEADSLDLARFEDTDSLDKAVEEFESAFAVRNRKMDYKEHLHVLFLYRDPVLVPIFKELCDVSSAPLTHQVRAINILGETGGTFTARVSRQVLPPFLHECKMPESMVWEEKAWSDPENHLHAGSQLRTDPFSSHHHASYHHFSFVSILHLHRITPRGSHIPS